MRKEVSDIAIIGIAVMGENLALNMESKGYRVSVSSRKQETVDGFLNGRAKGKNIVGTTSLSELVASLKKPRKVMLMVKAGDAVDSVIERLLPLLSPGDVIIDGGNSHYIDTTRRVKTIEEKGMYFVGTGVSGGEEGALKGPSIMPGGSKKAWPIVKDILTSIAARVDSGEVCCDWVGKDGAGHFVKMVHNGIEYGDMQLISEAYFMMRQSLELTPSEISEVFAKWNESSLDSYLIEITADILAFKDEDGAPLIDKIVDKAGQKGTGKWTVNASLEHGVPLTLISDSVFARYISALKEERMIAEDHLSGVNPLYEGNKEYLVQDIEFALYAAKIISYTQGFALMRQAALDYDWTLDYGSIALMWRGGCIIRSRFLGKIKEAFDRNKALKNLMLDPYFSKTLQRMIPSLRKVVSESALKGIPMPTMHAALSYYDSYRTGKSSANLIQAQRDYFGAHTYERVDKKPGEFFHTNWTGRGGRTASTTYNV